MGYYWCNIIISEGVDLAINHYKKIDIFALPTNWPFLFFFFFLLGRKSFSKNDEILQKRISEKKIEKMSSYYKTYPQLNIKMCYLNLSRVLKSVGDFKN